jgi:hypothetical protein
MVRHHIPKTTKQHLYKLQNPKSHAMHRSHLNLTNLSSQAQQSKNLTSLNVIASKKRAQQS